jgi:hypothetical protein
MKWKSRSCDDAIVIQVTYSVHYHFTHLETIKGDNYVHK